jgi:hypothetical protein
MEVVRVREVDQQSAAEVKVAQLLHDCNIEGIALWGFPFFEYEPKTKRRERYEADFLLVLKEHGLIALEVKGGRVSCEVDGLKATTKKISWSSLDRDGQIYPIKSPDDQADRAKWAFIKRLKNAGLKGIPAAIGVVLPDTQTLSANWIPKEVVGLKSDCANFETFVRFLGRLTHFSNPSNSWNDEGYQAALAEFLPTKVVRHALSAQFDADEHQIEENSAVIIDLVTDQVKALREVNRHNRALISGFPGTGKTLIAIRHARTLANSGLNTLFVALTEDLADRVTADLLQSGTCINASDHDAVYRMRDAISSDYVDAVGQVVVGTPKSLFAFISSLVNSSSDRSTGTASKKLMKLARKAPTVSADKWADRLAQLEPRRIFEAFFFDEGQDLSPNFIDQILRFADSREGCPMFVFSDLRQQQLRWAAHGAGPFLPWHGHIDGSSTILLGTNCRNASSIGTLVGNLEIPYPCHPLSPVGQVRIVTYPSLNSPEELGRLVEHETDRLRHAGIRRDQIMTIFCQEGFRSSGANEFAAFHKKIKQFVRPARLWYSRDVKGLESPAVIAIFGPFENDVTRIFAEAHLACSRAKTLLVICCPEQMKDLILVGKWGDLTKDV